MSCRCIVPSCSNHCEGYNAEDGDEALCEMHWEMARGPLRDAYDVAWDEATAAEEAGEWSSPAFPRVCTAWEELKAHALRKALS